MERLCPGSAGRTLILLLIESASQDPSRYQARKRRETLIDRPNHGEYLSLGLSRLPAKFHPNSRLGSVGCSCGGPDVLWSSDKSSRLITRHPSLCVRANSSQTVFSLAANSSSMSSIPPAPTFPKPISRRSLPPCTRARRTASSSLVSGHSLVVEKALASLSFTMTRPLKRSSSPNTA